MNKLIFKAIFLALCISQTSLAGTDWFFSLLTLDDAVKKVSQMGEYKVLATKTESQDGKQIHVIKVLSPSGRIQHIKMDAENGQIVK